MKKIILVAALFFTIGNTYANTLTSSSSKGLLISMKNPLIPDHNAASLATFNAMFPGAFTIKWQIKGEIGYQVTFIYNGVKMTAKYSYTGVYLGV
jgi:hypothetical protein